MTDTEATRRRALRATLGIALGTAVGGCLGGDDAAGEGTRTEAFTPASDLSLRSPAFEPSGSLPEEYTCTGEGLSPPLLVEEVPDGASSLALVVDDVDATEVPKTHWLLWNVPADVRRFPEGVPPGETVESLGGAHQGQHDAGGRGPGYGAPCPPKHDEAHTYRFVLYALSRDVAIAPGADRGTVTAALSDARIARARLLGSYDRNLHVDPQYPLTDAWRRDVRRRPR